MRLARIWQERGVPLKALSFALIGIINSLIDAGVFALAYVALDSVTTATPTLRLIAANVLAWGVAVSGSYVMNAFVTFAAESGGRLRWRDYATFAASGIVGLVANTAVLVLAAQVLPVWAAKGLAILTSFTVNFSLSHFVVFRSRPGNGRLRGKQG